MSAKLGITLWIRLWTRWGLCWTLFFIDNVLFWQVFCLIFAKVPRMVGGNMAELWAALQKNFHRLCLYAYLMSVI